MKDDVSFLLVLYLVKCLRGRSPLLLLPPKSGEEDICACLLNTLIISLLQESWKAQAKALFFADEPNRGCISRAYCDIRKGPSVSLVLVNLLISGSHLHLPDLLRFKPDVRITTFIFHVSWLAAKNILTALCIKFLICFIERVSEAANTFANSFKTSSFLISHCE